MKSITFKICSQHKEPSKLISDINLGQPVAAQEPMFAQSKRSSSRIAGGHCCRPTFALLSILQVSVSCRYQRDLETIDSLNGCPSRWFLP